MPTHKIILRGSDFSSSSTRKFHLHTIPDDVPRTAKLVLESSMDLKVVGDVEDTINYVRRAVTYPHVNEFPEVQGNERTVDGLTYRVVETSVSTTWNGFNMFWNSSVSESNPRTWLSEDRYDATGVYIGNESITVDGTAYEGERVHVRLPYQTNIFRVDLMNGLPDRSCNNINIFFSEDGVTWQDRQVVTNMENNKRYTAFCENTNNLYQHILLVVPRTNENSTKAGINELSISAFENIAIQPN